MFSDCWLPWRQRQWTSVKGGFPWNIEVLLTLWVPLMNNLRNFSFFLLHVHLRHFQRKGDAIFSWLAKLMELFIALPGLQVICGPGKQDWQGWQVWEHSWIPQWLKKVNDKMYPCNWMARHGGWTGEDICQAVGGNAKDNDRKICFWLCL